MYIEPNISGERRGHIEVICGSMFSGKTEELIRRLKRVKIANLSMKIFKPKIDIRYHHMNVVSHDENALKALAVEDSHKILTMSDQLDVVGIDEAQFFDEGLADVCDRMAYQGVRVIVAGLDMDFTGKPFGQMPVLLSRADFVTKLHAICVRCGHLANYSFRKVTQEEQIVLGESDSYEPRCRKCFFQEMHAV